jgi:glutathione S-transferase
MAILDAALARTGAYVLGAEFTLADVVLGLSVHRWQMTPSEKPDLAAVRAYCALLGQREGFRKHCSNGTP